MVEDSSSVAVLDTAAGVWCDTKSVVTSPRTGRYSADAAGGDGAVELTRQCRHAAAAVGDLIFIYGGLRGGCKGTWRHFGRGLPRFQVDQRSRPRNTFEVQLHRKLLLLGKFI
ncbi:putative protein-serine/threonine phosphatase [Helianthus annuus]|uniref:Kelch-type beta propeller n=1 Tax=Helianthus annuus TaxID=4232 RepID=A0A9K3JMU9_HELAN|nr:serine/threonine-protein phosphatase BSL3-like isoform X2 [Helianthus annuus]XP_022014160.1 serine/threonine-protein phosphatase BSL3-like isoform X2 [Helianthus annuus]XP_022014166.1 serine/threonine-protein phosphatase BSL3-like isoform X2 [Helianthus annuus]XP_022014171.1 serine/threonine-protein phosphatase BSL3-like isoform X2 [Helianthus annuus]XP_022014179.1 serine/threonine-protein phosphatase BSL3-like isoform X2 [Helianthus annuus]XP_035842081.1 serine/threonine-protein phosphatas